MPGFNQTQLDYKVLSGNQVVVMLGAIVIAFAQTADQGVDFGAEDLYGIGTAKPQEIQQLRFDPSLSVTSFVLTSQGVIALNNPSNLLSVLANNSFVMNIIDANGNILLSYIGCVCANYSQNIPANAIVTQTLSFKAMDVLDTTGQSVLNGNFALQDVTQLALAGTALSAIGA